MDTNRFPFTIMVNGRKELVSALIEKNIGTFETNSDYYIPAYNIYGMTVMSRLYDDDSKERYFHLYFDPSNQIVDRRQLEKMVDKMKSLLDKHLGKEISLSGLYHEYFNLHYNRNGTLISYTERDVILQRDFNLCGYFCIITSEMMTASEALNHYAEYNIFKQYLNVTNTSIGSDIIFGQRTEKFGFTQTIIDFIALIVRNQIHKHLKEMMLRQEGNLKFMTVREAIQELEKIEMVRRSNGMYRLDSVLTRKQKMVLSVFGISDADIRSISDEIGCSMIGG